MRRSRPACVLLFAISLLAAQSASAILTVGPGCGYASIQAAINIALAAEAGGEADPYIGVVAGIDHKEALTIDGSNINGFTVHNTTMTYDHPFVQIYGDYKSDCTEDFSSMATVSAAGKSATALSIHGNRPVEVVLNHLTITNADSDLGGAINFTGSGTLDLTNVSLVNNVANFGGGIFANGQSSGLTITLHTNTSIFGNTAHQSGGGILVENIARLVDIESPTLIYNNTAIPGIGGGLEIYGQASADIGGNYPGLGVISYNHAKYGGGIAVLAGGGLRLFSTVAGVPVLVANNTADTAGGGLYVDGNGSSVCASGYGINGNTAGVSQVTNGDGSAIMTGVGAGIELNESALLASNGNANIPCGHGYPLPPARTACPPGGPCNTIDDNINIPGNFLNTITVSDTSTIIADRFEARRNTAGAVVSAVGHVKMFDCLIADNTTSFSPIFAKGRDVEINGCTIAGNVIGQGYSLIHMDNVGHIVMLANSILALNRYAGASGPVTSYFTGAGTLHESDIIASETASLTSGGMFSNVNSYDPKFVDVANGDYHLRPESPAVNYSLQGNPLPKNADLDGNTRDQGVPFVVGNSGWDVGAYEVQNLGDDTIFFNAFGTP